MKYKHTFAYFYSIVITVFTIWSLLDTFVIAEKIAVVDASAANTSIYEDLQNTAIPSDTTDSILIDSSTSITSDDISANESEISSSEPIITDYSYQDENILITN